MMKLTGWDILYLTEQDQYVGSTVAWATLGEWVDKDASELQNSWPMIKMTNTWVSISSVVEDSYNIRKLVETKCWRI
jgi:hypothetical protein